MRTARRRERMRRNPVAPRMLDGALVAVAIVAGFLSLRPLVDDLRSAARTEGVISSLSATVDETDDEERLSLLHQAQAYNAKLCGKSYRQDNEGFHGCNGGPDDIADSSDLMEGELAPYERQLSRSDREAMGWVEIASIGVRQPLRHGTSDEVLAAGIGHLEWSSLPVGGVPSHCILAGHSGMTDARMLDDLDRVSVGDSIVLHVLGDAYQYEVYETEVVLPDEVRDRCAIVDGEDLCTLMTCTPYGINSHRLLVHARRRPFTPHDEAESTLPAMRLPDRRTTPPLILAAMLAITLVARIAHRHASRCRWQDARLTSHEHGTIAQRHKRMTRPENLGLLAGLALVGMGCAILLHQSQERQSYRQLAVEVSEPLADTAQEQTPAAGIDWSGLKAVNGDVAAWVRVEGTDIDLPVVAPSDGDMSFYLTHDLWRRLSIGGVPFLDHRCGANDVHRMAFGHHLGMGGQFSSLQRARDQAIFDTLGRCQWQTPERGSTTLLPYCAFEADMWCEDIQEFEFDDEGLRTWLRALANDASARAPNWEDLADGSRSAVTLVTCSSSIPGQRWRTFMVFVEVGDAYDQMGSRSAIQSAGLSNRPSSRPLRASLSHAT